MSKLDNHHPDNDEADKNNNYQEDGINTPSEVVHSSDEAINPVRGLDSTAGMTDFDNDIASGDGSPKITEEQARAIVKDLLDSERIPSSFLQSYYKLPMAEGRDRFDSKSYAEDMFVKDMLDFINDPEHAQSPEFEKALYDLSQLDYGTIGVAVRIEGAIREFMDGQPFREFNILNYNVTDKDPPNLGNVEERHPPEPPCPPLEEVDHNSNLSPSNAGTGGPSKRGNIKPF